MTSPPVIPSVARNPALPCGIRARFLATLGMTGGPGDAKNSDFHLRGAGSKAHARSGLKSPNAYLAIQPPSTTRMEPWT